ncbi:MAG TPA: hypothetical protein VNN79_18915 [Actinomycetota bacterium]|nr:hypothetical protein [Actinomycetota bacterium]
MTDVLTLTQALRGGAVTAQGTPDTTVAVAAGFALVANQLVSFTAGNLTPAAADATLDRFDAIGIDSSGTKTVIQGAYGDGLNAQPPDTTGYALLAYVYILNQASPSYTGTIIPEAVIDMRDFALQSEPTCSMIYTNLGGGQSDTDPGAGNLGFSGSTFSNTTSLFVSYLTSSVVHDNEDWLTSTAGIPYYIRLFQRSNPENWAVYKVTAATKHTNYDTLTVSFYEAGTTRATVGARGGLAPAVLGLDSGDLAVERGYQPLAVSGAYYGVVTAAATGATQASQYVGATTSGAPASGTHAVGDFIVDQSGSFWICTAAGTPGTWVQVGGSATGRMLSIRHLLNGTTSYTPTSGTGTMYVECQAGGAGARAGSLANAIGGSGGGAYSASKITSVNAGAHTVAIGAGGAAGANNGNDTSMTLAGGEGGTAPLAKGGITSGTQATSVSGGAGGPSGTGTGDITADGGGGGPSFWYATGSIGNAGAGGGSFFGSGGVGLTSGVNSTPGGLYGGGASGNSNKGASSAAGGDGLMRITEYS